MTIGIYALYWEEPDLVYIGLSNSIERRIKEHKKLVLAKKHPNYKVQNAWELQVPKLVILEICSESQLERKEKEWYLQFDNTINIAETGVRGTGSGEHSPSSKYSKYKMLRVFSRLIKGNLSFIEIARIENVDKSLCYHLISDTNHLWLNEEYPNEVFIAKRNAKIRKEHNIRGGRQELTCKLLSPLSEVINVTNISQFAKQNNLHQSALSALIKGTRLTHKGWKLYNPSILETNNETKH